MVYISGCNESAFGSSLKLFLLSLVYLFWSHDSVWLLIFVTMLPETANLSSLGTFLSTGKLVLDFHKETTFILKPLLLTFYFPAPSLHFLLLYVAEREL